MIECPHCGNQNQPTHRYCGKCGKEIQRPCPNCKALMETNRGFCGKCGASLSRPASPKWSIEDRKLIARLKGVWLGVFLPVLFWLGLVVVLIASGYDEILGDATVFVLFFTVPIIVNAVITIRPSGVRAVLADNAFISQTISEMVAFPGRVMRFGAPWSWLLLVFGVLTFCATAAVLTILSTEVSLTSFLLNCLFLGVLVIPLSLGWLAIMGWGFRLRASTFGRLTIQAALRSLAGFVIGTLVAASIAGLELVVVDAVLGLYWIDDPVVLLLVGSMLIGGGLMVAIAMLSESFDRYLVWARYRHELEVE